VVLISCLNIVLRMRWADGENKVKLKMTRKHFGRYWSTPVY